MELGLEAGLKRQTRVRMEMSGRVWARPRGHLCSRPARQLERKGKPGGQHSGWSWERRASTGAPHCDKKPVSRQAGTRRVRCPSWGEAPQAGCAISRDEARSHGEELRDSSKCASCVCVGGGGEGCCPGRDPSAMFSRLTCLGGSWELQPWLLDLPWRDCISGQMPPTPTPCRTREGAEQSPRAGWSSVRCQLGN